MLHRTITIDVCITSEGHCLDDVNVIKLIHIAMWFCRLTFGHQIDSECHNLAFNPICRESLCTNRALTSCVHNAPNESLMMVA